MQKAVVKSFIITFLLLIYINRGLFVFANEIENQGGGELNSVIEWALELATGKSNDIDEDGDMQTDYSFASIFHHDFPQQLIQINLFPKDIKKIEFPYKETSLPNDFCSRIDYPPEIV